MLVACVALAVLIAFSLQQLVPQNTSTAGLQPAQTPSVENSSADKTSAQNTPAQNQSAAPVTTDGSDADVELEREQPSGDIGVASGAGGQSGAQGRSDQNPDSEPEQSAGARLPQPSGSVLLDSVSNAGAATQGESTNASEAGPEEPTEEPGEEQQSNNDVNGDASSLIDNAANLPGQAKQSVEGNIDGSSVALTEEATEAVTLERIPRSNVTRTDGPDAIADEEPIAGEEPLTLGLNANAGKVIVSGKLPRSRFASVLLQVLRSSTDKPLDARKLELVSGDTRDTPWVFDIAKAMGSVELEFSTLDLQSDGKSITVVGDVSTITEKQELLAIFESDETSLKLHPDSQILVVPVQQPQLSINYAEGEYEISGMLANAQRELFERSVANRNSGGGDMRWRRKVHQLEIIDSLSVILDIMQKSLRSGVLIAGLDSMELQGIVSRDQSLGLTDAEQEAGRRNVVAVFSSVLPETESLRIDIRLNPDQLARQAESPAQSATENVGSETVDDTELKDNSVAGTLISGGDTNSGLQNELERTTRELQARFEQFEFAPGQSELSDENREILDQLFEVLFLFPSLKANMGVDVVDQNRSVENLSLSRQRADRIRDYVIGLGVESYRLTVAGYGDSRRATTQTVESGVTVDFSSIP